MLEQGRGEKRVGYLIKRAQHALRNAMDQALRDLDVTPPQYAVLALLDEEPDLSNAELARRAFVTPQTMHEILANLEAGGLVGRSGHRGHGHLLQVYLTNAGRWMLAACHERVEAIEAQLVSRLDPLARRQLADTLERCIEALQ
jgi:DNA-binding MarR family transcriptional regulator